MMFLSNFIFHVEKFIKILCAPVLRLSLSTRTLRPTEKTESEELAVKCRDEKLNSAVDQGGIKFQSLQHSPSCVERLLPFGLNLTANKFSFSFHWSASSHSKRSEEEAGAYKFANNKTAAALSSNKFPSFLSRTGASGAVRRAGRKSASKRAGNPWKVANYRETC